MRVLCLHGYHGRGALVRDQLRAWDGVLAGAELVCVDAPSLAAGDFGWWHVGVAASWARTRAWLDARAGDRLDGVIGFSQGAALAALVAGLGALPSLRFAVMIGGFASGDPAHASIIQALRGARLPSLHVIGRGDRVVPPDASRALASRFVTPIVLEHDGGHVIPSTTEVRAGVAAFLAARA